MTIRLSTLATIALILMAFGLLVTLGTWQFSRHQEKQALSQLLSGRTDAPPLQLQRADVTPRPEELNFRRVRIAGTWDFDYTLIVTNRVRFGTRGEQMVVPLLPHDGGAALLVDRGWYPRELREQVRARLSEQPAGTVKGMARDLSGSSARLVTNVGWTDFRPLSMAETLPYNVVGWGLIEGDMPLDTDWLTLPLPGELPQTGYIPFHNTIPHLEYALTWWGLAMTLAVVTVLRVWIAPRQRHV